jgi:D-amino-acid dehydrogenase
MLRPESITPLHSHLGFTLGPPTGRMLAEMMSGEKPFVDPAPFRAERF